MRRVPRIRRVLRLEARLVSPLPGLALLSHEGKGDLDPDRDPLVPIHGR